MKTTPIKSYKSPKYPTIELFVFHPHLLSNYIPYSWRRKGHVAGALITFVLLGCSGVDSARSNGKMSTEQVNDELPKEVQFANEESKEVKTISVAPLFIHGDGRGATGCVVVAPPVFLTEEEARQTIAEEMKKENIVFDKSDIPVEGIAFNDRHYVYIPFVHTPHELVLDAFNTKYNLGYKFISGTEGVITDPGYVSLSHNYNTIEIAENLRKKLRKYNKMNAVIFYDPLLKMDFSKVRKEGSREQYENSWEQYKKDIKKKAIEQLSTQVNDFIDWIRKEGILKQDNDAQK